MVERRKKERRVWEKRVGETCEGEMLGAETREGETRGAERCLRMANKKVTKGNCPSLNDEKRTNRTQPESLSKIWQKTSEKKVKKWCWVGCV